MFQNQLKFSSDTTENEVFSKIFEDVQVIAEEATNTIAEDAKATTLPVDASSSSRRHYHINDSGKDVFVGMESDLKKIKKSLGYVSSTLQILPIVGMGGIGKTTLAAMVYKDDYIRHRFDVCAWATVSQQYCFRAVMQDILNSANLPTKHGEGDDGELGGHLYKSLHGRRYLIVLDDVWYPEIWDDVRRFLPHDDNGSCVLLTTRSSEVARCACSSGPQLQMRFLKEHESQRLLHTHIFGEEDCPEELKGMQDEIAQRCKGLPLALVVIGCLLLKVDKTRNSWRRFADSLELAATKGDGDKCMEILSLSYNHLPHHLRPCFLYMGMFPEDYEVSATKLIQLWSDEGFLSSHNSESPEELGEEYLVELVERNLILISSWSSQGRIKKCKIHDVLRKLCLREA